MASTTCRLDTFISEILSPQILSNPCMFSRLIYRAEKNKLNRGTHRIPRDKTSASRVRGHTVRPMNRKGNLEYLKTGLINILLINRDFYIWTFCLGGDCYFFFYYLLTKKNILLSYFVI